MNYIVFDLEWNQPAWGTTEVTEPLHLTGEIIEIGAVKLDDNFKMVDELCLYIIPQYYTNMNQHVVALTKLHGNFLEEHGQPFPEAFARFQEWCGEECAYMTWSDSDLPMLVENMILHGIPVDHLPPCIDVQRIFGREIMRTDRQFSLDAAIEVLKEKGERAHDALHDAKNTVKVIDHLDLDAYIEEYAAQAFSEPPLPQTYESTEALLEDEELKHFPCPWCGGDTVCEKWYKLKGKRHFSYAQCPEGDEFAVYLRHSQPEGGKWHVNRLFFSLSDDVWEQYQEMKEKRG